MLHSAKVSFLTVFGSRVKVNESTLTLIMATFKFSSPNFGCKEGNAHPQWSRPLSLLSMFSLTLLPLYKLSLIARSDQVSCSPSLQVHCLSRHSPRILPLHLLSPVTPMTPCNTSPEDLLILRCCCKPTCE
jgi:hypothetical protein